jgi:hypothetical protein
MPYMLNVTVTSCSRVCGMEARIAQRTGDYGRMNKAQAFALPMTAKPGPSNGNRSEKIERLACIGSTQASAGYDCRNGVPTGIRTPVVAVKGRCPRPLDDGDRKTKRLAEPASNPWWSQAGSNRRPLQCHCSALPAELWPQNQDAKFT